MYLGKKIIGLFTSMALLTVLTACETIARETPGARLSTAEGLPVTDSTAKVSDQIRGLQLNRKYALIVTIGQYSPATQWERINSGNDYGLIRSALEKQGFAAEDIHHLSDSAATREGILAAINDKLLLRAGPGDTVVFHYSGHGQQITDDNHDELDGYDEALVPYDAPQDENQNYQGERHLRDDELNQILNALRRAVGPDGDVLFTIDSCYSGTITRGQVAVRGTDKPLGLPQAGATSQADKASGMVEVGADDTSLASFTVLSAVRHNQLAEETKDGNRAVGSLSLAFSSGLERLRSSSATYRDLFDQVKKLVSMQGVNNQPQAEGSLDRQIFNGRRVGQKPYFEVSDYDISSRLITLNGGRLVGLLPGSVIQIHPPEARDIQSSSWWALGEVVDATPFTARVALSEVRSHDLEGGWAFVKAAAFGDIRLTVDVQGSTGWADDLRRQLRQYATGTRAVLEPASDAADITVRHVNVVGDPAQSGVIAESTLYGATLIGPLAPNRVTLVAEVLDHLKSYARNRYLRKLELTASAIDVRFDVAPCELKCSQGDPCNTGRECSCEREYHPDEYLSEGNIVKLKTGTGLRLRGKNYGREKAYVSLLDLISDGTVFPMWPRSNESIVEVALEPDQSFTSPLFAMCPPYGVDVLKLFATTEPVDFRLLVGDEQQRATRSSLSSLEALFGDALDGTRGAKPVIEEGLVNVFSVPITIVK